MISDTSLNVPHHNQLNYMLWCTTFVGPNGARYISIYIGLFSSWFFLYLTTDIYGTNSIGGQLPQTQGQEQSTNCFYKGNLFMTMLLSRSLVEIPLFLATVLLRWREKPPLACQALWIRVTKEEPTLIFDELATVLDMPGIPLAGIKWWFFDVGGGVGSPIYLGLGGATAD